MKKQNIIFSVLLALVVFSCVRDWLNPYDSDCPPEVWTPQDLNAEKTGDGVLLTWQQYEKHFDGFTLERSPDSATWKVISPEISKTSREFTDTIHRPGEAFYYRIVAVADKNKSNYAYSALFNFPTELPTVQTNEITNIDSTRATFQGFVLDDGGEEISQRGFYYSTEPGVDQNDTLVAAGAGIGEFSKEVTGLVPGQTYYVNAYAVNTNGIQFGTERSFNTLAAKPHVVIFPAAEVTSFSAELDAEVLNDGGAEVDERGFCYLEGTASLPEIQNNKIPAGTGTGTFAARAENLLPGKTYTIRAFAKNVAGIAYSDTIRVNTPPVEPTVVIDRVEKVKQYTAEAHGNVTYDGGAQVTERGFCWSENSLPTLKDSYKISDSGIGIFDENIAGLAPNTMHFIRAYAINEVDTAYSEQLSFKTLSDTAVVITKNSEFITSTSAVLNGQLISNGGSQIQELGFVYLTELDVNLEIVQNPMPDFSNTVVQAANIEEFFNKQLNALQPGIEYFVRTYAINEADTSFGNTITFITLCKDCNYDGTFVDPDGREYNTKQYGDQIWMTENLAYLPSYINQFNDSSRVEPRYYVYGYDGTNVTEAKEQENFDKYGVLYNWVAADQLNQLLENGWRLPTDEDWMKLEKFIGMPESEIIKIGFRGTDEGVKLKFCRGFSDALVKGTDEFCFSVKASGVRGTIDWGGVPVPFGIGLGTAFWSSTINQATSGDYGYLRGFISNRTNIMRIDGELDFGFSVRLVKDAD